MCCHFRSFLILGLVFQRPGISIGTGFFSFRRLAFVQRKKRIFIKITLQKEQRLAVLRLLCGGQAQCPPLFFGFYHNIFRYLTDRKFYVPFCISAFCRNLRHILFLYASAVRNRQCAAHLILVFKGNGNRGKALGYLLLLHQLLIGTALGLAIIVDVINTAPFIGNKIIGRKLRFLIHMPCDTSDILSFITFQSAH